MDFRQYLPLSEHPVHDTNAEVQEGLRIGFSKRHNEAYFNCVTRWPADRWGTRSEQVQSCVAMKSWELWMLIETLKEVYAKMDQNEKPEGWSYG